MITTTTCSNCGAHVSVFRVKAHRRSPVCGEYRRSNEAAARLNAHAGDFVTVVQLITVKLQGLGVRTVRPAPNKNKPPPSFSKASCAATARAGARASRTTCRRRSLATRCS